MGEGPRSLGLFLFPSRALQDGVSLTSGSGSGSVEQGSVPCCPAVITSSPIDPVPASSWLTPQGLPRVQSWNRSLLRTWLDLSPAYPLLDCGEQPAACFQPGLGVSIPVPPGLRLRLTWLDLALRWVWQLHLYTSPQVPADPAPEPGLPGHHSRLQPEHAVSASRGRCRNQCLRVSPKVVR